MISFIIVVIEHNIKRNIVCTTFSQGHFYNTFTINFMWQVVIYCY